MGPGSYGTLTPINYSQKGGCQSRKARKSRVMFINGLNYEQLKGFMQDRLGQPKLPTASTAGNSLSALNEFLRERNLDVADTIGQTLRDNFHKERDAHLESLRDVGRPGSYIKTRRWLLGHWHSLIRKLDHEGAKADGVNTPLQAKLRALMQGRTYNSVARKCGLNAYGLADWCNGGTPRPSSASKLARLEVLGDMRPGELTELMPFNPKGLGHTTSEGPVIAYRKKQALLCNDHFFLLASRVPPVPRAEWLRFGNYKISTSSTSASREQRTVAQQVKDKRVKGPTKKGERRKTWRLEPLDISVKLTEDRWMDIFNGKYCSSAKTSFQYPSSFWGWAVLSKERGGIEMPLEQLTLGSFADEELLEDFHQWRLERSENINNGTLNFLKFAASLLHPKHGFLLTQAETIGRLDWELRVRRGDSKAQYAPADWIERCKTTHAWIQTELEILKEVGVVKSRDPCAAIRAILEMPMPMDAITQAVRRMELDQPPSLTRQATHARNTLLLALTASNALRAKQLKGLTYLPDNTGKLYQNSENEWRIRIPRIEFKNYHGAAAEHDYDQAINAAVWPLLRRYFKQFRPVFGGSRPELVFVSMENPDAPWDKLNQRFFQITKKYVSRCRGFGPHSMRHIYVTSTIIKLGATEQGFATAASAIHDKPETTKAFYTHILAHIGDAAREAALGDIIGEMAPRRPDRVPKTVAQQGVALRLNPM
jgi:hypothetical protein